MQRIGEEMSEKEEILGVKVSNETYESITKKIFLNIEEKKKTFIVAVNPEKVIRASNENTLKELINSADFQIPDGIGLIIASKIKKGKIRNRITGVDLMMRLVEEAANQNKKIFLYGGKPGIAEKAKDTLLKMYPDLQISGTLSGYIDNNEEVIETINKEKPDLLFVALGSPKQEEWILANKEKVNAYIFQGVGGSFDVLSGKVKRAPEFYQKLGLEWLYRLIKEPWRWKRQLALPKFLIKVLFSK